MHSKELIDVAFSRAREQADKADTPKGKELARVKTASEIIKQKLENEKNSIPMVSKMGEFSKEVYSCMVDMDELRKALGHLTQTKFLIEKFSRKYLKMINRERDRRRLSQFRKSFYGRAVSVLKNIDNSLDIVFEAKKKVRELPNVKEEMKTVIFAGYPNVGKTTLLSALTESKPEIANYPFTTKGINVGYAKRGYEEIQMIDTPGLLDRKLSERNRIEMQAIHALTFLGNLAVFIIDPTKSCGYDLEEQIHLLKEIKRQLRIRLFIVINKTDIASEEEIRQAEDKVKELDLKYVLFGKNDKKEKLEKELMERL